MADNSFSDDDDDSNDEFLDQTIDSTTFGIPQHSHRSAKSHQQRSIISASVATSTDNTHFLSAKESFDSLDSESSPEQSSHFASPTKSTISLFGTDVLAFFSPSANQEEADIDMPKTVAKGTMPAATEEEPHFDAATHIYEGAKNAWTWGRGLPLAGSVLGLYESAALTIVSKTTGGKDATTLDKEVLYHINGLDKDIIDPAIAKLMAVIWPGVEKAEDVLKCIPMALYLFPMLKEEGEAEPETTPVPKVTSLEVN